MAVDDNHLGQHHHLDPSVAFLPAKNTRGTYQLLAPPTSKRAWPWRLAHDSYNNESAPWGELDVESPIMLSSVLLLPLIFSTVAKAQVRRPSYFAHVASSTLSLAGTPGATSRGW